VDGGVLDPVPVGLARSLKPNLPVVAVVLSPPIDQWAGTSQPRLLSSLPFLNRYVSQFRFTQALNIFMRSIDIGGALLTELLLEVEKPDVLIRPAVRQIGLLDQVDVAEVSLLGQRAAERCLAELNRSVSWPARLERALRPRKIPHVRLPYASDFLD
jgi:predicted acylesterase/phospholipase RssA